MKEEIYTYSLPCGLRGVHLRNRSNVAHFAVTVNAGSRDELPTQLGVAHLTEHTIFKGTTHRKAYQVNCRLENLGGELNAFTTKEDTTVHATVLRSDFGKAVELLSDILLNSTFPPHEIEREKQVVIDEINTYKDIPSENIFDDFEAMIFEGSTLGNNILGTRASVRKLDSDAIRRFIDRTCTPDRMVVASIGSMNIDSVKRTVERYFGDMVQRSRTFERVSPAVCDTFTREIHKPSSHQSHCIIGARGYSMNQSERVPLLLLVNMLGGPAANSSLNVLLREHNGLSYSVDAQYTPLTDTGIVEIYFSSDKDKTDRCAELVNAELRRLQNVRLSALRLSMIKKQYAGQFAVSVENPEGYMLGAGKSMLVYDSVDTADEIFRKIDSVTADDILQVANQTFANVCTLMYR